MIKPHIPNPCPENWETMKIGLNSRFCENCKKDVVDFTGMSRQQILETLFSNHDKKICGRFKKSQLDFTHTELLVTINALSKQPKNSNLAFYLLTMGTLLLASCNEGTDKADPNTTIVTPDKKDKEQMVVGEIVPDGKTANKPQQVEPVELSEPPTMGEPCVMLDTMDIPDVPYKLPQEMPEFIGGTESLLAYIKNTLQYPKWESDNKIEGTIYVTFVIDKTGKVKDPRIIRGVSGSKNFTNEVIRFINGMPLWKPGKNNNEVVDAQFTLPIKFTLK
jgi:TonB family protein